MQILIFFSLLVAVALLVWWSRLAHNKIVNKIIQFQYHTDFHNILHIQAPLSSEKTLKEAYYKIYKSIPRSGILGWWWLPRKRVLEHAYKAGILYLREKQKQMQENLERMKKEQRNNSRQEGEHWSIVLEVNPTIAWNDLENHFRRLKKKHHPDNGGDSVKFDSIMKAYERAKKELKK